MLLGAGCSAPVEESDCEETKTRHKNGTISSAGKTCSGQKQGVWEEWYSDGTLRWSGQYKNDTLQMHTPMDTSALQVSFLGNDSLQIGKQAPIRVRVGDIHPSKLVLMMTKGTIKKSEERDMYDYVIHPEQPGKLKLIVQWTNPTNGLHEVLGEKRYTVRD